MQQAGFHHANMIAAQLQQDITTQNAQLMAMMENMQGQAEEAEPAEPTANATVADNVNLEMLRLLHSIQQRLSTSNEERNPGDNNNRRRNRNRRTPDDASFNRRVTDQYCWTHGGCNHTSAQCSRKAPGHQDNATFENRMGGSCAFCPP